MIVQLRLIRIRAAKKRLEMIVEERTLEVVKQKEIVEQKNRDILDSINYAKLIQESILPPADKLKKIFPQSFILFKPKDIVSGDFYWFTMIESGKGKMGTSVSNTNAGTGKHTVSPTLPLTNSFIIASVDCTGHGVPGAFMSMIGNAFLNEIVNKRGINQPAKILRALNDEIVNALKQTESSETKDGMDIALVNLEYSISDLEFKAKTPKQETGKWKMEYAGAFNPLYIIRKNIINSELVNNEKARLFSDDLCEIKGNRFPIGMNKVGETLSQGGNIKDFTNHKINLQKGDTIYIFSDGYSDQFGGPKGKKFAYKHFKQLLLNIQHLTMEKQCETLDNTFENWKGDEEQIDDVLVIGIRI